MVPTTYQFQPDYAVPPGWVLEERLEANGISQAEFARRCGRSPKFISDIIAGKAPIEAKTALQFEKVLGVSANIWLGIEKRYRLHLVRLDEAREAEATADWARSFPVSALESRGAIRRVKSDGEKVTELLSFFGVASNEVWQARYNAIAVAFRHSQSFTSDKFALAAWLRLVEIEAEKQTTEEYDRSTFMRVLKGVRQLTRAEMPKAFEETRQLLGEAGVTLVRVKQLPKARLSGATRWLSPRKPVIALSGRHGSDDQIWFSLFHEAAHILLHSKKRVYVDGDDNGDNGEEGEANKWAENFLIPRTAWQRFLATDAYSSEHAIYTFASEQRIAPGIVVGRLQHEGLLAWKSGLNRLKVKVRWE